jgi:DNA-binding XRE family transcriptional regulator
MQGIEITPREALVVSRKRRGLTQREAADILECNLQTLLDIEKGRLIPANTENGLAIAVNIEREFGIPVSAWSQTEAA